MKTAAAEKQATSHHKQLPPPPTRIGDGAVVAASFLGVLREPDTRRLALGCPGSCVGGAGVEKSSPPELTVKSTPLRRTRPHPPPKVPPLVERRNIPPKGMEAHWNGAPRPLGRGGVRRGCSSRTPRMHHPFGNGGGGGLWRHQGGHSGTSAPPYMYIPTPWPSVARQEPPTGVPARLDPPQGVGGA